MPSSTCLAGRVEDVQQAGLRVDDGPLLVGVLDGGVVVIDEVVLDVLEGQGALPDPSVAEHDQAIP